MNLSTVTGIEALDRLVPEWEHLWASNPDRPAYHHPRLQVETWRMRQDGSEPVVAVVRDASGQCTALLPCAIATTRQGPFRLRTLRPLPQPTWPDFGPVAQPGTGSAITARLCGWIEEQARTVDRVDLRFIRDEGWPDLVRKGHPMLSPTNTPIQVADFPAGASQWHQLVGRHARAAVRGGERRLRRDHEFTILRPTERFQVIDGVRTLGELHTARAEQLARTRVFAIGTADRDFPLIIADLVATGVAEFHALMVDGELIAGQVNLRDAQVTHAYRLAFRESFASYSPGTTLQAAAIQACLDRGDTRLDFGLGRDPYKSRWSTATLSTYGLMCGRGAKFKAAALVSRMVAPLARLRSRGDSPVR